MEWSLKNIFNLFKRTKKISFPELFDHFQQLIKENNLSLEIIADMGEKLSGEYIFDRHYIETSSIKLADSIYKMIYHLEAIAPGKYSRLLPVYAKIRSDIEEELKGNIIIPEGNYVLPYDKINDEYEDAVGGKNAHLGVIKNLLTINIPDGFAITTKGFLKIVKESNIAGEISDIINKWEKGDIKTSCASKKIQNLILSIELPKELIVEVNQNINKLKKRYKNTVLYFAVRSSCIGEDSEHSFAGIYESYLGVPPEEILDKYKEVIASTYSERAMEYRRNKGFLESEIAMAVGCQKMIQAKVSGVMYTLDPFNPEEEGCVIAATYGLGEGLVSGKRAGDKFYVSRTYPHELIGMDIIYKKNMSQLNLDTGKIEKMDVPDKDRDKPCLTNEQIRKLVQIGMRLEKYFKYPQDIEFAFDMQNNLIILQSRQLSIDQKKIQFKCDLDSIKERFEVILSGQGEIVQEGIAIGEVYKITSVEDLENVPDECILVASFSSPLLAKVIKKVNGIITDIGSPIGHLSTIAREFRIPMIINTKKATKILKNGQKITLNATDNVIYNGYLKELCYYEFNEEKFEETKEYRLLKRIYKRISPLNLVDPTGNDFRPENCKTFHDIIRYIHEKAVQELIDQNCYTDPKLSSAAVKLKLDIPLDLIVIDISENAIIKPRQLHVNNLSSMPLKYFIKGVCSENVWSSSPVGIGFKSFMSSMNKTFAFDVADPKFIGQNLAVVSKEYANISLRLGYHFTMIDTIASDDPNSNYIYFRFFGGVSENVKRARRARLIGRILTEQDFLTDIKGDLVVGRLKGMAKEETLEKIMVLGILVAFTRQLDVQMTDDKTVDYFAKEFHKILLQHKLGNSEINL